MTTDNNHSPVNPPQPRKFSPLRHVIWRGISIIAPPLITLLLLIWLLNAVEQYVLKPLESAIRFSLVAITADIVDERPAGSALIDPEHPSKGFTYEGFQYVQPPIGRRYMPSHIISHVNANLDQLPSDMQRPLSTWDFYNAYVKLRYMPRSFTIPLLLLLVLSILFFVGRFFAAGVGRFLFNTFERIVTQLPIVSNVYSSVKQVTDFVFSERDIQFTRAIAVEYPKAGIWSLGFVTGDSFPQLKKTTGQDYVSVFIPTSPMPMTGFTINVVKSSVVDLDVSVDQAIQFIVSCGVVCPVDEPVTLSPTKQPRLTAGDSKADHK